MSHAFAYVVQKAKAVCDLTTCRCIVQLTILGYILVPIFTTPYWFVVVLYALLMGVVGAWEASSRPNHNYKVNPSYVIEPV